MNRPARRALLFLGMVAAGLLAAHLLADPFEVRSRAPIVSPITGDGSDGRVTVRSADEATTVRFGEVSFELRQPVRLASGEVEERAAYRVHMLSGGPDASGAFLAHSPTITPLDPETGEARGRITAQEARFEADEASGGGVTIDLGRMQARDMSLTGDVRGEFVLSDGSTARLEAARILVESGVVTAPGHVRWWSERVSLEGLDMRWDGAAGLLVFESEARLVALETPRREFFAPGGLSWTVPPAGEGGSAAASGELRGRVTGSGEDGLRLEADTLGYDEGSGELRLEGDALIEREDGGRDSRLSARRILVETDEQGRFAIAQADGEVRLVTAPLAAVPAWMLGDSLRLEGEVATSPGAVRFGRGDLQAAGDGLRWDAATGRLDLARDAELDVASDSTRPLAGLALVAPGGMSWTLPPGAVDPAAEGGGELRGGVTGTLPDGSGLRADVLLFDGPSRAFDLVGAAEVEQTAGPEPGRVSARRIHLAAGDDGRFALLTADGEVVVLRGPADVVPMTLTAERVERRPGTLLATGPVTWEREGLHVVGTGMRWDEDERLLVLERDAALSLHDPDGALDMRLRAAGGLSWVMPADAMRPASEGRGELRGRVSGTAADGSTLEAGRLLLDGESGALTLLDDSTVVLAGGGAPTTVRSDELVLVRTDESSHVSSTRPIAMELPGAGSGAAWTVAAGGGIDWRAPAGTTDPLREGRGELRGGVEGTSAGGSSFATETLRLEGARFSLEGASRWQDLRPGRELSASAARSLVVERDEGGEPLRLQADGDASAVLGGPDPMRLSADRIELDRTSRTSTLVGGARLERPAGGGRGPLTVTAGERLVFEHDAQDELVAVRGSGRVSFHSSFTASGDSFSWDLPADLARLSGRCRLVAGGVSMTAAALEVRPREESFRIFRSSVRLDE